jgi:hypothetical protein
MELILMIPAHEIIHDEHSRVHEWRVGVGQGGVLVQVLVEPPGMMRPRTR